MNHGDSASNSTAADGDARDTRVGQILNEFLDRRASGELVSEAALLAQHPDLAGELRECLELVRDLQPPADRIDALIAQGVLSKSADPRYLAELGLYKITDFIGRGGMGVVLKAYEESLDRTVALKILRPELADDGGALTRFEREAKAAAALNHPNIVTVHAIGQERGSHYIAMEHVAGPSLADVIHNVAAGLRTGRPDVAANVSPPDQNRDGQRAVSDVAAGAPARPINVASGLRRGPTEPRPSGSGRQGEAPAEPDTGKDTADPSSRLRAGTAVPHIPLGRESFLGPDLIRSIFRQLLSALAAAQEAGLIHRDVKSSNILLDEKGFRGQGIEGLRNVPTDRTPVPQSLNPSIPQSLPTVKLADFGLARMITATTRITLGDSVLGTPEYMSPEQARGDDKIDHRTDLYSAGVVLYEMLTGRTPFHADTPTATIHRILHDDPPEPRTFNQEVDPVLASLSLRLMAKQPEDRFASTAEVIDALDAGERVSSLEKRRRVRRWLLLVLFSVVILSGWTWLWSRFSNRPSDSVPTSHGMRRIVKVWVGDPDTTNIWAKYSDGSKEVLHEFPPEVDRVKAVAFLELDGTGDQVVVAGLNRLLAGQNLFAFDARGNELWRQDVSNVAPDYRWPDCGLPAHWPCYIVTVGDLDGRAGAELVVVAKDTNSYPTRISRIDVHGGQVSSTFWHMGHFEDVQIAPDFFGPGRAAIIAWGFNNKLDGFGQPHPPWPYECAPGEDPPRTRYDQVTIVMILDPESMDGLGPPRLRRGGLPDVGDALPFAYAFLDRARHVDSASFLPEGEAKRRFPRPREVGRITQVQPPPRAGESGDDPRIKVHLGGPRQLVGGAVLTVDRNLNVLDVELVTGAPEHITREFWRALWRPIIQNGEYLGD